MTACAATCSADEYPTASSGFYSQLFAESGPLDRLKKRSAKHRWNQLRRERTAKSADEKDRKPNRLNGSSDQLVPDPTDDEAIGAKKSRIPADSTPGSAPEEIERQPQIGATPAPEGNPFRTRLKGTDVGRPIPEAVDPQRSRDTTAPTPSISTARLLPQPDEGTGESMYSNYSPTELKSITAISPFRNYEPDQELSTSDPCNNLCPRPDGLPCISADGSRIPECPEEIVLSKGEFQPRMFEESCYAWEPSNVFSLPLYFEDPEIERYGLTHHDVVQPFVSVGKFGLQLIGLPYQMVLDHPCKKVYPLGWYRSGECVPKRIGATPWSTKAGLAEAAAVTGVLYLFP